MGQIVNIKKWLDSFSMENKGLHYKLTLAFSLFFLVPVFGFLYFAVTYNILQDANIPLFFIALLIMSFFGFFILRKIFDSIISISKNVSRPIAEDLEGAPIPIATNELQGIVTSFQTLQQELKTSFLSLKKKTSEIFTLNELLELCYITFNPEDLLYITLERALKLTNADIGSVLILENPKRNTFIVEATIGQGEHVKRGDRVDYANSIAKYAVINKSPMLVDDIETDIRFGRQSRPQYATKSFICMPLKTINDVIGVLTISRRKALVPFTQADVDVLTLLLGNVAFTYDNFRLLKENEESIRLLKSLDRISKILNSSLRGSGLFQSIFRELRENIPYESAIILGIDKDAPDRLVVVDFLTFTSAGISRGNSYVFEGSTFDKVFKQQSTLIIEDTNQLSHPVDREFFLTHGLHTAIITPLIEEDRIAGLLILCNVLPEALPDVHKRIDTMAATLALSLERERLLFSVAKRHQELETIRQVGGALSTSTFDMEKVLTYTMDMIRVAMNVEAGTLMLMDGNELKYEVAFNLDMKLLSGFRLKLGQGIAGHAAANGKTIVALDARNHPHFSHAFDKISEFRTKSVLCVPMISQGKVTGVIEVRNKVEGIFDENDIHLLQSIATSVTIAMENARLYRETVAMAENERSIRNVFQKFVPKEVVDKIILGTTGEKALIDEFKTLTLLNIDIRGFSKFSKNLGPQKTVALLNYFFSNMGEIVFKHRGIVDKYLGDGLLAIFGAPVSSPFDADNAIAAALDMQQTMGNVNEYLHKRFNTTLSMGISIHTGEVVVGNIGFDKKMDYTVIGDPVNFVFKLQAMCKSWPNSILISEKTRHAAQSHLNVEEVETFEVDHTMGELKIFKLLGQQQ
jgi:adenylate cyclase